MKKEYNFSKGIKNPYSKKLKTRISINVDNDVIDYFKKQSNNIGIPYQTLINLLLRKYAENNKNIDLQLK